jgi:hypothetical protein
MRWGSKPDGFVRRHTVASTALALVGLLAVSAAVLVVAGGSGGSSSSDEPQAQAVLDQGAIRVKLPPGYRVDGEKIVRPKAGSGGAQAGKGGPDSAGGSSIPLDSDEDPTTALFTAFGKFRACLDDLGVEFIGAPDPANPDAPQNDPNYLEALGKCAARSQIVEALNAAQAAEANLTPEQIEQRNKGYLIWRKCMIERGWKIAKPTPDSEGRLFSIGSNSGQQIEPPPGKDIISSSDVQECAGEAERKVPAARG